MARPRVPQFPDGSLYNWTQTDDQLAISIPVPENFKGKDATIVFEDDLLSCRLKGEAGPRVMGRLYAKIQKHDCMWQLETDSKVPTKRLLTIHLEKAAQRVPWPILIVSGATSPTDADPQSLYEIGNFLHSGLLSAEVISSACRSTGVAQQQKVPSALEYMNLSAEATCVPAQLKLAAWYELGSEENADYPVQKDPIKAHYWHTRAAEAGSSEACYIVGTAFVRGDHGVPKSYSKGLEWFERCAEEYDRVFPPSSDSTSVSTGSRTASSPPSSSSAYASAPGAPQRSIVTSAHFHAGLILMEGGLGVGDPDPAAAARHFQKAADYDHPDATYNLGIFYLNGYGVSIDVGHALNLIKKSMSRNPLLKMPPQLEGLGEEGLEVLKTMAAELQAQRQTTEGEQESGINPRTLKRADVLELVQKVKVVVAERQLHQRKKSGGERKKKSRRKGDKSNHRYQEANKPQSDVVFWGVTAAAVMGLGAAVWYMRNRS
ncbi:hypothetical protein HK102_003705 [Quaeritorhiza haematococci]|nr:hypothetical protein HK102_003705 [Quaeritorhiza haematococci]